MSKEYSFLPMNSSANVRPYTIKVSTSKVKDMEALIKWSPVAQPTWENQQADRKWGLNREWLVDARQRWVDGFKWEQQEEVLNSLPQFMATVRDDDGVTYDVHFMALFSKSKDAIPVVFFHGWPVGGLLLVILPLF
jgi:microsomal epoxide hydrolase